MLYRVEAFEKFIVRTVYFVEADSGKQAEERCKNGEIAYVSASIEEGDEQWIETVDIEEFVTKLSDV